MVITSRIFKQVERFSSKAIPAQIVVSPDIKEQLLAELGVLDILELFELPIVVSEYEDSFSITDCALMPSTRTPCPSCGCMSYESGYCNGCGTNRNEYEDESEPDLVDLFNSNNIAYGYELMEDEV